MAKQEIKSKQTNIVDRSGTQGHQVEQTLTVDDNCLPSAAELLQYKEIDPNIIPFIIETTKTEQNFRHDFERKKLKVISRGNGREYWINWWGMFFACLVMLSGLGLAAFLIYHDKVIVGTIFAGTALVIAASIFIRRNPERSNKK